MTSRILPRLFPVRQPLLRNRNSRPLIFVTRQSITTAPSISNGPLLERRPDRPLPELTTSRTRLLSIPLFLLTLSLSALAIFNYQKSSSSVVTSTLYALRGHPLAREALGSEIAYASKFPWIWGELDQFHGKIDISYAVKGTKREGVMRFKSTRIGRMGLFETEVWELTLKDGRKIDLLDRSKGDPFPQPTP